MSIREIQSATTQISQTLAGWPGVKLGAHRCGGIGIFVEGQELGQLHHCGLLDVSLTAAQRDVLLKGGQVHRHHTFPDSGRRVSSAGLHGVCFSGRPGPGPGVSE